MTNTNNIPYHHRLSANLLYLKELIIMFLSFRHAYTNYLDVTKKYLKNQYPIELRLKNGETVFAKNSHAVFFLAATKDFEQLECDFKNDVVIFPFQTESNDKKKIKIYGGINNGDIINIFFHNEYYNVLPVKDRTVIDIGSNIGDSSIYFVLCGANRVIALEPFPLNFELAVKNIQGNSFDNTIITLLAGCASKSGHITIDPHFESNVDSRINEFETGIKVPLMTLKQIIEQNNIPKGSILKIDCEGCEYDTIMSSSSDILHTFTHIFVEYHHGYQNLKRKLEESGFCVSVTSPVSTGFIGKYLHECRKFINKKEQALLAEKQDKKYQVGYVGMIHAVRN